MSEGPSDTAVERDVLDEVQRAIEVLEAHPDPAVRGAARTALQGIDAVHRAGLTHLVQAIRAIAGDAFLHRLIADPAIRLLLMSYGLIAVDRRIQAEEAVDAVRGHLHTHGVDIEILDVVGGVVHVRLHAARNRPGVEAGDFARARAGAPGTEPLLERARRDVEAALAAGLVGFQELVIREREPARTPVPIVPLDRLRRAHRPVYRDALAVEELPPGTMRAVEIDGVPVVLASAGGEVFGLRNRCGDSPLPLEFGSLEGFELRCPWHGCRYDLRTGRRTDGVPGQTQVFPVSLVDGRIRIAVGAEPAAGDR